MCGAQLQDEELEEPLLEELKLLRRKVFTWSGEGHALTLRSWPPQRPACLPAVHLCTLPP